jgi:hypothetical protein
LSIDIILREVRVTLLPETRKANPRSDDQFCMNNNNDDYARMYKYIPGSTLGASIITAVVLHYFFPIMTVVIPFPYNLLGLLIVGLGVYLPCNPYAY